jgi:predicted AlkP superfamily pyrophosphatase or phosphodiesterase
MNKLISIVLLLFIGTSCAEIPDAPPKNPKLIVGIVVDQMRFDHLYKYGDRYSDGGFRRLMREGYTFRNAHINYIPTVTAAGHASIYTGATPSMHGIIGNGWYDRQQDKDVGNVDDISFPVVGSLNENSKGASPDKLLVNTITDQLRLGYNFNSKVISMSLKDRGAILPGGHLSNGSYWHDWQSSPGYFVSSTYFMEELPEWVTAFNRRALCTQYLDTVWNTLYPIDSYQMSLEDDNKYERSLSGKDAPVFPYDFRELSPVYRDLNAEFQLIWASPAGNTLLVDFAMAAIENENLGKDTFPDLLNISFSATDAAGHAFGPQSIEMEDIYLRLDLDLQHLFNYLDREVGKGNYTVFLTSDHGVVPVATFLFDNRLPTGIARINEYKTALEAHLNAKFGKGEWIQRFDGERLYLDRVMIEQRDKDLIEMQETAAVFLMGQKGVSLALTANDLQIREYTSGVKHLLQNGHHPGRSGDVLLAFDPGFIQSNNPNKDIAAVEGSTHGSGYAYDTHIPLVFYGPGIPKGSSSRKVGVTDISPTLAIMLNLQLPNGTTGEPLQEILNSN